MKKKYKQYNMEVEDLGARKMAFTISTASVDRDGDSIDAKGWQLDNYIKNPVVLWAHDYSQLPVGKAVNIQATDKGLRAEVEFPPLGTYPFADQVHDMVKNGFLNATSVGFAPKEHMKAADRERGYDFKSQELLEFSIVPVPCNPEALAVRGVTAGQIQKYAKVMRHWSKDVLGEDAPKLDAQQFDNLADAIAKIMQEDPEEKEAKIEIPALDYQAIAEAVADLLEAKGLMQSGLSNEVIDIKPAEPQIEWDKIQLPARQFEFDMKDVCGVFEASMKESLRQGLRELVEAEAQAAIQYMTGRLD